MKLLSTMTEAQCEEILYDWNLWGRHDQIAPGGDWSTWCILAGRGFGKALALDTPVPTPTGWTTMGDLSVGDLVLGADGAPTVVTYVTPVQYGRDCFSVTFSDGEVIVADADHQWSAADKFDRKRGRGNRTVTTREMLAGGVLKYGRERNWSVPMPDPLKLPEAHLPVAPWLFGLWLGDGASAEPAVYCGTADLDTIKSGIERYMPVDWIAHSGPDGSSARKLRIGQLWAGLVQLDAAYNKHIPTCYLRASVEQRQQLLAGLIDSDGFVAQTTGLVEIVTVSEQLRDGIVELALSLGYRPKICAVIARATNGTPGNGRKAYRISWTTRESLPGVVLARKRLTPRTRSQAGRMRNKMIVAIEPVPSEPVRCISVAATDSLYLVGRRFTVTHNTRTGSETIRDWVCGKTPLSRGRYHRIALVAETAADARDVMVEGDSGILSVHPKEFRPLYEPSKRRLTWPNGAVATLYNATEPNQLRGPQHDAGWCDELAKWAKARETWDQLQFGMRLGTNPRTIVTTTPRNIPVLKEILADPTTIKTIGRTMDNKANLAKSFIEKIHKRYAGTRLGRQELEAEVLDDIQGALWNRNYFDPPDGSKHKGRVTHKEVPDLVRIVVGVDPSGTGGDDEEKADTVGIIVAGVDAEGHGYVLADRSSTEGPAGWGRAVKQAYEDFQADRIVAEKNFGGAMVEHTIRTVDPDLPVTMVNASRGKVLRAEPIAALYEQGRVSHVQGADIRDTEREGLMLVEDQLCLMSTAGFMGDGSPDRVDALVWALTELMLEEETTAWVMTRRR